MSPAAKGHTKRAVAKGATAQRAPAKSTVAKGAVAKGATAKTPAAGTQAANRAGMKRSAGTGPTAKRSTGRTPAASNAPRAGKPSTPRRMQRLAPDEIEALFLRLSQLNPTPTTELEYSTPYELLVAVTLSAQATDVGVNKATRKLFKVANTPAAIAALGVDGLKPYIATIGLFNTKAANVVAMAHQLLERHDGQVPRSRDALQALPGVGRKTANVVLNTAFGEPTIAVDTHIFRVANRTGLAPGKDVRAVEEALEKVVPRHYLQDAHHWLILHGRYICKARKPDCPHCPIRDLCRFPGKTPGEPGGVDPDA